jgi:hypothetical protein
MADVLPLLRGEENREEREVPDEAWTLAVLDGEAAPALAAHFRIHDLQQWLDLSA